jgi:hypothetical protein
MVHPAGRGLLRMAAAWLAAMAAVVSAAQAAPTPGEDLQPLAGLHEEVVLPGVTLNGRRIDLNRFVDRRPPRVLQELVQTQWTRRPAPVHVLEREGWLVLVQAVGTSVETMELRAHGTGTEGRRLRLSLPDPRIADASAWLEDALPAGCRILRRLTHRDGERSMTTLVAVSTATAASLSRRLLATFARQGFQHQPDGSPSFVGTGGSLQFLTRGNQELALAISEQAGERAVVLHWGRTGR